MLKASC